MTDTYNMVNFKHSMLRGKKQDKNNINGIISLIWSSIHSYEVQPIVIDLIYLGRWKGVDWEEIWGSF